MKLPFLHLQQHAEEVHGASIRPQQGVDGRQLDVVPRSLDERPHKHLVPLQPLLHQQEALSKHGHLVEGAGVQAHSCRNLVRGRMSP